MTPERIVAPDPDPPKNDPPEFELAGQVFVCLPELPAPTLTAYLDSDTTTQRSQHFLEDVLPDWSDTPGEPSERERFDAVIADKRRIVPPLTVVWLAEQIARRYLSLPLVPAPFGNGSAPTEPGSEDGPSPKANGSKRSKHKTDSTSPTSV